MNLNIKIYANLKHFLELSKRLVSDARIKVNSCSTRTSSTCSRHWIQTLIERTITQNHESEYREGKKLKAPFGQFGLLGLQQREENQIFRGIDFQYKIFDCRFD